MNILLTNDDGYFAEGLNVLLSKLEQKHSVFVVAPNKNRSAASHKISMSNGLEILEQGNKKWSCSGYPVDCVVTALRSSLLPQKIDCVVSGINAGANIGTDVIYSGTCAAARQGSLYGLPSIAFSLIENKKNPIFFDVLADFAVKNLEKLLSICNTSFENPSFVNVNALSIKKYKGVHFARALSVRDYGDLVSLEDRGGFFVTNFKGGVQKTFGSDKTDFWAVENGFVSVSVIESHPYVRFEEHMENINFLL